MAKKEANLETIIQKLKKQGDVYQNFENNMKPLILSDEEIEFLNKLAKLDIEAMKTSIDKIRKIEKLLDGAKVPEETAKEITDDNKKEIVISNNVNNDVVDNNKEVSIDNIVNTTNSSDLNEPVNIVGPTNPAINETTPTNIQEPEKTVEEPIDLNSIPEISWDSFNSTPVEVTPTSGTTPAPQAEEISDNTVLHM